MPIFSVPVLTPSDGPTILSRLLCDPLFAPFAAASVPDAPRRRATAPRIQPLPPEGIHPGLDRRPV